MPTRDGCLHAYSAQEGRIRTQRRTVGLRETYRRTRNSLRWAPMRDGCLHAYSACMLWGGAHHVAAESREAYRRPVTACVERRPTAAGHLTAEAFVVLRKGSRAKRERLRASLDGRPQKHR